jgi:hypothetical protein
MSKLESIRWFFVKVYLTPIEMALLDKLRGTVSRSGFLRSILLEEENRILNTNNNKNMER